MKNLMLRLLILLWLSVISSQAWGGTWTANEFVYKPEMGARGTEAKTLFDSGVDRIDARLGKEIWVGDPKYGPTLPEAIAAIGSNPAILRIPTGTYAISSDLTIPTNITLKMERGAILSIAAAKTITINGGLDCGPYRCFDCTGTGKVVWNSPAKPNVLWWGENTTPGTTDMQAACQAAVNAVKDGAYRQNIYVPNGTYYFGSGLSICRHVGLDADPDVVYTWTGNFNLFTAAEDLYSGFGDRFWTMFKGGKADCSSNPNNVSVIYIAKDWNRTIISLNGEGNPDAEQNFIHWDNSGGGNDGYHNLITSCALRNFKASTGVLYFQPYGSTGRANDNWITNNYFSGYRCVLNCTAGVSNYVYGNFIGSATEPVNLLGDINAWGGGSLVSNAHNGADSSASLIDTTKNFSTLGVQVGQTVVNMTDLSYGYVTGITTTTNPNDTLQMTLQGGTDNDWDNGDAYHIIIPGFNFPIVLGGYNNVVGPNYVEGAANQIFACGPVSPGTKSGAMMLIHNTQVDSWSQYCDRSSEGYNIASITSATVCELDSATGSAYFKKGQRFWGYTTKDGWFSATCASNAVDLGATIQVTITEPKFQADLEAIYPSGYSADMPTGSRAFVLGRYGISMPSGLFNDLAVARGTTIKGYLSATAAWTPGAIAAGARAQTDVTLTDACLGDTVMCGYDQNLTDGLVMTAWVKLDGTVRVQIYNSTAGSITPTAGTVRVSVIKH